MSKVYEIVRDNLIEAMEKGITPWNPEWVKEHQNFVSGYEYRGVNTLLLTVSSIFEGYKYPFWLTWNQINKKGYKVKKGAKSHIVVFFKMLELKEEEKSDDNNIEEISEEAIKDDDKKTIPVLRYYKVFNIESIEGYEDLVKEKMSSKMVTEDEDALLTEKAIRTLNSYCSNDGISVYYDGGTRSYYSPVEHNIHLPKREMFLSSSGFAVTFAHECVHSTGKSLSRPLVDNREQYSFEELVAEMGAAFFCAQKGVKVNIENSAAYLKGWSQYLRENRKSLIFSAAREAEKAVEYIEKKSKEEKRGKYYEKGI